MVLRPSMQAQQLTAELLIAKVVLEKSKRRAMQHEQMFQDNAARGSGCCCNGCIRATGKSCSFKACAM
jgi:hypothetical protein